MSNLLSRLYRHHPRGGDGLYWSVVAEIVDALDGNPSDDYSEENEAIDWLNKECFDDTYFLLENGDLMLVKDCENDNCDDRVDADGNCLASCGGGS
jgi:hypothetical protein